MTASPASPAPAHEDVLLVAAHHLVALVLDHDVERDDAAIGPGRLTRLLHGHLGVDRVAELHRHREAEPIEPEERQRRPFEPPRKVLLPVGNRKGQDTVGDARAERGLPREDLVGVERVEIAGEPREARDVAAFESPPARHQHLAYLEILEIASARLHRPSRVFVRRRVSPPGWKSATTGAGYCVRRMPGPGPSRDRDR